MILNITAVPVVWAFVVAAQKVGDLCLLKDGITRSEFVISVLQRKDSFKSRSGQIIQSGCSLRFYKFTLFLYVNINPNK